VVLQLIGDKRYAGVDVRELAPLADFPAIVVRVQSMADKGVRAIFDMPESETNTLAVLHGLQRDDKPLRVVIYDDDEFQKVIQNNK
jgi:hypothetical protein